MGIHSIYRNTEKAALIQVVAKNRYHRLKFAATARYWNDL